MPIYLVVALLALVALSQIVKILDEYERGVVFRLGRVVPARGPGLILLIPFLEKMRRVDTRTITLDIASQDVITRDNISLKINAVLYFKVVDTNKAIVAIEDFQYATSQLAQTSIRTVCGELELDELLVNTGSLKERLRNIIAEPAQAWGIEVSLVELKHIDLSEQMRRAMAKQAEAERERRAVIIAAEGELQSSQRLVDAACILGRFPEALQLRYLQTARDMAVETKSKIYFPIPIDFLHAFPS